MYYETPRSVIFSVHVTSILSLHSTIASPLAAIEGQVQLNNGS